MTLAEPESPWKAAVEFGTGYAHARTVGGGPKTPGAEVRVQELLWQPVDTTELLIAFATVHAFCNAIGRQPPPGFRFDPATGEVAFPNGRAGAG